MRFIEAICAIGISTIEVLFTFINTPQSTHLAI